VKSSSARLVRDLEVGERRDGYVVVPELRRQANGCSTTGSVRDYPIIESLLGAGLGPGTFSNVTGGAALDCWTGFW
jgi:hypothetical protein